MPSLPEKSADFASTELNVAIEIAGLRYGDLMGIGRLLVDMCHDVTYDLETPEGFAALLHAWAESKIDIASEEE